MADGFDKGATFTTSTSWQKLSALLASTDHTSVGLVWEDVTFHATATNTPNVLVAVNIGDSAPSTDTSSVALAPDDYRAFAKVNLTRSYVKGASGTPTVEITGVPK